MTEVEVSLEKVHDPTFLHKNGAKLNKIVIGTSLLAVVILATVNLVTGCKDESTEVGSPRADARRHAATRRHAANVTDLALC